MLKALGSRLTYANVMATVAVFLALGGGAYALTGIPDRGGVFHGCVSNTTGLLRVVKSASSCQKSKTVRRNGKRVRLPGEFAVAWNQQGRPGIQGQQGQPGSNATINGVPAGGDLTGTYPSPALAAPEGFHEVGAAGEPPFENSWHNPGVFAETVAFFKDREGVVHLKGTAASGTHAQPIFHLPAGYRPASGRQLRFGVACGCTVTDSNSPTPDTVPVPTGQAEIDGSGAGNGAVTLITDGGGVDLDGITYRAAS